MTPETTESAKTPEQTETIGEDEAGLNQVAVPSPSAEQHAPATRLVKAPRRRTPKLDALLAESVDAAREALAEMAESVQIGEHRGVSADDDRLVTHRFAAELPGYRGWDWFATLARAPRSRQVTVCEIGLLPGEDAIVAPDWVPWSDRVSDEEKVRLEAIAAGEDPEKALQRLRGEAEDDEDSTDGEGDDGSEEMEDDESSAEDPADEQPQRETTADQD